MIRSAIIISLVLMSMFTYQSFLIKSRGKSPEQVVPTGNVVSTKEEDRVYFRANGADAQWNLTISTDHIDFMSTTKGFEKIITPHIEPVKAMDSDSKQYNIDYKDLHMIIEISMVECSNAYSNERFPYSVEVTFRRGKENNSLTFSGCGLYITDPDLQAKWVLHQIQADTINASQFDDTIPFVEISTKGNSFSGYTGCNNMKGRLFSERSLLRFTDLILSKKSCGSAAKEKEFVNFLQFSTQYKIEQNKLILSNPGGMTLGFTKLEVH